ncbi:MAG: hypothetical protein C0483_18750 [Pirellula sp.]|nr:hypothetical protein [Pirellula sp.]
MNPLDDIFSEIGLPTVRAVSSRRRDQQSFSPAEQDSLLRRIGSTALSGIGAVGNLLDLPGSMVRDTISGHNPFDQLLSPFSGDNRQTGRDVLSTWGVTTPNDPTRWEAADFGGFGAEVALDPLTYFTLGLSALGKGGRVAKNAGLLADLAKVAGKRVGAREARLTTTLDDLLSPRLGEHVRDPFDAVSWAKEAPHETRRAAAQTAAKALGIDDLASVTNQPLGGLFGIGLPFQAPASVHGSVDAARRLDSLGRKLQFAKIPGTDFSPVSALNRLFSAKAGDATSQVGQTNIMPDAFNASTQARADSRGKVFDLMSDLARHGGEKADDARYMRRLYEGFEPGAAPELAAHADKYHAVMKPLVTRAKAIGMPAHELIDDAANYATRRLTGVARGGSGKKVVDVVDENFASRLPFLKNLGEGTDTILQMRNDPAIEALRGGPLDALAGEIRTRYGAQVPESFTDELGNPADQREALARWFQNMDDSVWESGIFGNHPLVDASERIVNGHDRIGVAENILDNLDLDTLKLAGETTRSAGQARTLKATLEGMGLVGGDAKEGALKAWLERRGMPVDDSTVKWAGDVAVPLDLSDDLIRKMQAFKSPEAVNEFLSKIVDPLNNITKAGLTSAAPAFHVRNFVSGQWQNMQAGQFSLRALGEADKLARGGAADVGDIPIIRQMLQQQGLANTPENATDMLRRLGYQHNLASPQQSVAAVQGPNGAPAQFADMIFESPGGVVAGRGTPYQLSDALTKLRGGNGTTWDLRKANARGGFSGAAETTFAPLAAGEHVGSYVESLNRYTPFIENLRKGMSPSEAAARVMATQVDYAGRNYTKFEKSVVQRVFPFYKFTAGMVPYTLRRLWEKPGGAIAQTIRAENRAGGNDASIPDYVSGTASIPLGQTADGSKRFFTGFGLPFEDALSFAGGGVQGGLLEGASRLNPLLKAPLEWATGESFFQKGPQGGRDLTDLDPTIGRILSNVSELVDGKPTDGRSKPVDLPDGLEFLAGNSPLARLLSTARAATDPRKHDALGLMNLLSGFKVTDVSPASQDAMIRERSTALMKELGAKSFARTYFPKDDVANMTPEQQAQAVRLQLLQNILADRAKERKAAAGK